MAPAPAPARPPSLAAVLTCLAGLTDWERRSRHDMVVGLAPVTDLLQRLGRPDQALRCVHVAGSKGKGTVCALVAAGLQHAGWRVGVYASPHVLQVNERVVLDGRPLDDDRLALALHTALAARSDAQRAGTPGGTASHFDVWTAAAWWALAQAGCEVAVVETGLGGRDDSTNVATPEVAVITTISLEHTEVLGATRTAIAGHKAGIVKPGAAVVCGLHPDDDAAAVVAARAQACAVAVTWCPPAPGGTLAQHNLALARAALQALGQRGLHHRAGAAASQPLGATALPDAVAQAVHLPGRLQRVTSAGGVPVVLDGAHVADALHAVLHDLAHEPHLHGPPGLRTLPVVLLAVGADKPADALLTALHGRSRHLVCCALPGRACWPAAELVRRAAAAGLPATALEAADTVAAGLQRALTVASGLASNGAPAPAPHSPGHVPPTLPNPTGWVLVTGSLHLVAPALAALAAPPGAPATPDAA